jgi:prephenate dehydrogenase
MVDTGSTKVEVMRWAGEYLSSRISFIGGHPMAGKETSGIDEADAGLFKGCVWCLTPSPCATSVAVRKLKKFDNCHNLLGDALIRKGLIF